ncbi:MAG: TetR/AcrR family transcriptional regulator [Clostridiales bacterium]|nr:TetR/AcrR family transcriptional regulator [Clostridiales bacterium]
MARNKYPEVTIEKILDVAQRLFLEKGYDGTTIQDIVDELGGLTKGAIYHHFKSKEDIIDALGDKMFFDNNPFDIVRKRKDLNGLEKMKMVIRLNQTNKESTEISRQSVPILKNPRILAGMIESNQRILSPLWLEIIEEGNKDGSMNTEYAKELSEVFPLLSMWLIPSIFPASLEEGLNKFSFIKKIFDSMGIPVFDDEIMEIIEQSFSSITK